MRKLALLWFLIICCLVLCSCNTELNDSNDTGASSDSSSSSQKPNVELSNVSVYSKIFSYQDGTLYSTTEYSFDERGLCISKVESNEIFGLKGTYTFEYDEKGNLIKQTIPQTAGVDICGVYYYEYNNKGDCVKLKWKDYVYEYEYEYDNNGNILCIAEMYNNKITYEIRTYDEFNNLIKTVYSYDKTGRDFNECRHYEYDDKGNLISYLEYSDSVSKAQETVLQRDERNNIIRRTIVDRDKGETIFTDYEYEYDEKGNILRKTTKNQKWTFVDEYVGYHVYDNIKIKHNESSKNPQVYPYSNLVVKE